MILKIGTRNSPLALIQAAAGADELTAPAKIGYELIPFSSPGDRDLVADLRTAPADFFTRDIDDALRAGTLDCAIHSAKDLPEPLSDDLDFFWLPTKADPRDAMVCRRDAEVADAKVIGISSDRRNAWAEQRFPNAEFKPVRGNIGQRLTQLDAGDYDLLIIAAAALERLGLLERVTEYIAADELPPPEGQGALAVTFLKGNTRMMRLRQAFVQPALLAGAGPGSDDLLTVGAAKALAQCDICLYDALGLRDIAAYLPPTAKAVFVGKRLGGHAYTQAEITALLCDYVRRGARVVRLKGGDPGVFGRLAEEVEALAEYRLPFRVLPGVSSIAAATTGTGLLATRRGISRGFITATPRTAGSAAFVPLSDDEKRTMPHIFLMSAAETQAICNTLIREGLQKDTPASIVFDASMPTQHVISGTLDTLPVSVEKFIADCQGKPPPGIILVGRVFDSRSRYPFEGLLGGMKVLLTCSGTLMQLAENEVIRYNGIPVSMPMIELCERPDAAAIFQVSVSDFDWLICASPTAARFVIRNIRDLRRLPKIMVCGKGTGDVFRAAGVPPDAEPSVSESSGNEALVQLICNTINVNDRVLRICTDAASEKPASVLNTIGCRWESLVFADNTAKKYEALPKFDIVYFASGSAVRSFKTNFPDFAFTTQYIVVIGEPTAQAIRKYYPEIDEKRLVVPRLASTAEAFGAVSGLLLSADMT